MTHARPILSIAALLTAAALAGCAPQSAVRPPAPIPVPLAEPPATVTPRPSPAETITVRCPTAADIRRLRAARPKPLRNQAMPASPAERVARTAAQLGLYEARNAWADQVEDAFARCER